MKKYFSLAILTWTLICLLPTTAIGSELLSDNFDDGVLSSSWTVTGNTVQEADGVLKILQNTTDAGGVATSTPFKLPANLLTLNRKAKLHYANNYSMPWMSLSYRDGSNVEQHIFSIYYGNMSYNGTGHIPVYGTFLAQGSSNPHSAASRDMTVEGPSVLWDSWFDERISYDRTTGEVQYFRNEAKEIIGTAPILPAETSVYLKINSWGWFTGHSHYVDDLEIKASTVTSSSFRAFLSFPLACGDNECTFLYSQGAYTPSMINSVLDHQMDVPYGKNGSVTAFTNETGKGSPIEGGCYPKVGGGSFDVLGLYEGTPSDGCDVNKLNYDEHPGYDYNAAKGTPVKAAASGTVIKVLNTRTGSYGKCVPRGIDKAGCDAWGFVGIDHGNGYVTQYGHLEAIFVESGDWVVENQTIGSSGNKAPEGINLGAHLHFEVLKKHEGKQYGHAFVDPYGWEGKPEEDHLAQINGIENVRLWKFDPREIECLLNWAELSYGHLFSPGGTSTKILHPFSYRHYQITNSYLGVSSIDSLVYYVGPDKALQPAGDLSHWLSESDCHYK